MEINIRDFLPIIHQGVNSETQGRMFHEAMIALIKLLPAAEYDTEKGKWNFATSHQEIQTHQLKYFNMDEELNKL
jgi:hypothetical protein